MTRMRAEPPILPSADLWPPRPIEPAWAILNHAVGQTAQMPAGSPNLSECTQAGSIRPDPGWPDLKVREGATAAGRGKSASTASAFPSGQAASGQTMPFGVRLGGLLPMSVQEGGADLRALIRYS